MGNPVVHFEVRAKDPKKAQQFYAQLFQWRVDANNPMGYGMVDKGAEHGIAGGIGGTPTGTSKVTFYVEVPDLQSTLDKAQKLGGKVISPPMDVPGGPTMATFADPEGNEIGLVKAASGSSQR